MRAVPFRERDQRCCILFLSNLYFRSFPHKSSKAFPRNYLGLAPGGPHSQQLLSVYGLNIFIIWWVERGFEQYRFVAIAKVLLRVGGMMREMMCIIFKEDFPIISAHESRYSSTARPTIHHEWWPAASCDAILSAHSLHVVTRIPRIHS